VRIIDYIDPYHTQPFRELPKHDIGNELGFIRHGDSASNQARLKLVVIRCPFPGAAGEITIKAQRHVHFSLVAYRRRFYNTASDVRPHVGDVH
jgi:hypothetical protein